MPCGGASQFLILYGSQRGQAQSIAEEISEQAAEHGFLAEISCLSKGEKYNLDREHGPVVFVVSTTGDGEPPDTALKFVRKIKNKSLPRDHFSHVHYALLALGDTNYANFCNCGKTIDKRLQELGAKHFYATGHADDGTGLEVVVDPWIEGLWEALKKTFSRMSDSNQENTARDDVTKKNIQQGAEIQEKLDSSVVSLHLLKLSDVETQKEKAETSVSESETAKPSGAPLEVSLIRSVPPLSQSSLNVPALPPAYLEVCLEDVPVEEESVHVVKEGFHEVSVSRALHLTRGDAVKSTILLELDISDQDMPYQPGDAFDVLCPNRATEVEELLWRLGLKDQRSHCIHLQLRKDTKKKGAQVPSYIPHKCTLQYLLTWCLEIRSVPKKAFVRALVEWTQDSTEKRRLQELCSREGSADYNRFVRDTNVCLLDLLQAFKSCSPPLSLVIEHLPKLQPRAYSAASSSLCHPGKVHFVFSEVEFPACAEHPKRTGLCTGWLTHHVSPILQPCGTSTAVKKTADCSALPKIHVRSRVSNTFHLPSDPSVPLVMVGPGTGVAPFIGFLQQREKEREKKQSDSFGETWLFFGCRHKDRDFIFREELERFVENETLSHLKACFSRDEPDGNEPEPKPKYVQHQLLLRAKNIVNILVKESGYLYVCGDAKNMAKDVNDTLIEMMGNELQLDKLESMKMVAKLREEKRYLQDIWS
ncbi:methionine synthase reductase [Salminus brasiliensis]|uniref:methionine synthase reductase n=1 Tax=Salminus brasiliensis TaxID=930266 RepID=UPI003B836C82